MTRAGLGATMIFGLLNRRARPESAAAEAIHDAIVAAARRPELFRELAAPDTLPGRFEMIVLHVVLYLRRLRDAGPDAANHGQAVLEAMFRRFDDSMREIGVGDLTVPKRVKTMARAFYDGAARYDAALDGGDDAALGEALRAIVYGGAPGEGPSGLAAYVRRADAALATQPVAALVSTGPVYPGVLGDAR